MKIPDHWIAFLTLFAFAEIAAPRLSAADRLERFAFDEPHMGLKFRIVLYAQEQQTADQAARAAFDRIEALNQKLSDYEPESELNRLSQSAGKGQTVPVSDDLWNVLTRAQELAERSRGAFDVTAGPYVRLWRKARRFRALPPSDVLNHAGRSVGYQKLKLHPKTQSVELTTDGMQLDLGGIAKGYAVDEALETLSRQGITRALVAGGGDLRVSQAPPDKPGWRIAIAPLDVPDAPPAKYVSLTHRAVATSGDLFQYVELDGTRYSHILNPRTGLGLTDHSLVTIIAEDCTTADSLSTTVSVLGPQKGLELVESTKGAEAHIVRQPNDRVEVHETTGFKAYYE